MKLEHWWGIIHSWEREEGCGLRDIDERGEIRGGISLREKSIIRVYWSCFSWRWNYTKNEVILQSFDDRIITLLKEDHGETGKNIKHYLHFRGISCYTSSKYVTFPIITNDAASHLFSINQLCSVLRVQASYQLDSASSHGRGGNLYTYLVDVHYIVSSRKDGSSCVQLRNHRVGKHLHGHHKRE